MIPTDGNLPPKCIVLWLSALTFLKPDNEPKGVKHILAHPDTPTLASLEIHSGVFAWARKGMRSLNHLPNDRLPRRLWEALRGGYHSEVQHWKFCSTFSPETLRPSQCSLFYWSHHPHKHSQDRVFEIGYRSGSKFSGHTQKCE